MCIVIRCEVCEIHLLNTILICLSVATLLKCVCGIVCIQQGAKRERKKKYPLSSVSTRAIQLNLAHKVRRAFVNCDSLHGAKCCVPDVFESP